MATTNTHSENDCTRLHLLEVRIERLESAFPLDELGKPAFDGHRGYHTDKNESARMLREYQQTATKNVIKLFITGMISAVGLGLSWDSVLQVARDAMMGGLLP